MAHPYFEHSITVHVLSWSVALRVQLDRWEELVARHIRASYKENSSREPSLTWRASSEHHFCLVAAGHLLKALKMSQLPVPLDPIMRAELKEGRDLHEHWEENMPV